MAGSTTFRSLRHRHVRVFFLGLLPSQIGTWLQLTAMSLLVYRLTGKATDVGIALLCQHLPMLALGMWAGAIADRVRKRRMAIATQCALAAQAIVLGVLELSGVINLPLVYVLSFVLGSISALDNPARRGFVLELVAPSDISNVLALNTAVMTGSRIFGPAIAAVLIGPVGAGWLFIVNGLSYAATLWPMIRIDQSLLHPAPPAPRGGTPTRDALRFVRHSPRLLVAFVVFASAGTFTFNYNVSLLKLADLRFDDRNLFGWLLAATGVGSVAGSLMTASRQRVGSVWFFGAAALTGAAGLGVAFAPNVWTAYVMAVPLGIGGAALIASLNSIAQQESPPDMRGRLLALSTVAFLGTTPIGAPVTGWVADHVSAEWSLAYGSIIALAAAATGAVFRRRSARPSTQVPTDEDEPASVEVDHAHRCGLVPEGDAGIGG